ncbi:MAG TPA: outer membrane protein assembly factor BamA [Candidatus Margulisiibacteriota bacterium]|nr:outer membrane protein assembly factor BamA [Candidatus Margulisiibacteriota bacterium]
MVVIPAIGYAALAIAPAPVPASAQAPEASRQAILSIDFDCPAPIDRRGLLQIMPFKVGDVLQPGDLARARERLTLTGIFSAVEVTAESRPEGVAIVARLVRQTILNALRFRGNDTLSTDDLTRVARLREGTVVTEEQQRAAASRLRERYATEGFEAAVVTVEQRVLSPGEVDVTFRIVEGPPLVISAIDIAGALPVPIEELRAALGLKVGDRYVRGKRRKAEANAVRFLRERHYYEAEANGKWELTGAYRGILHFTIAPGPLCEVGFVGNEYFSDKDLLRLMDLETRPIVTDGTWRELARRARRAYQEAGYYFAQVDVRIEPGPPKTVRFDIREGKSYRIGAVTFQGNHSLSAGTLLAPMATRPPSWIPWRRGVLLDDVFDDDLKRLWFLYRRHGLEDAQIVDTHTRFDAEHGKIYIEVVIDEGRQTIVREIVQSGTELLAAKPPELQTAANQPLDPERVDADRRALSTAFGRLGYAAAAVTADVSTRADGATDAATVRFAAVPGEQRQVGTIIVQDDIDTRWRVITRELPFKSGDPLDPEALLQGQSAISRLGLFRSVQVQPLEEKPEGTTRDVGVSVSERPPGTFQWGAGYNTRDGFRGFTEVGYNNLQGLARRISLRGEFAIEPNKGSPSEYLGNLGFREPRLGDTPWTFRTNFIAQRSTVLINPYNFDRLAAIPAIERFLRPGLQVGLEYQAEETRVFDVEPDVLAFNPQDQGHLRTLSLTPFVLYDGRDDAFVPHRGVFESMRVKFAPEQLGSEIPFVRIIGQHSQYVPIADDVIFAYALRGGWARAYTSGNQVPIRERFYLGGRTTVRGFSENSVGPQGNLGNPIGGDWAINVNSQVTFPLIFGLGGEVFADGGGAYVEHCPSGQGITGCAINFENFRRSAGLGLRYVTPVGPITLEYGFKLDRRSGESVGEVHFSIGNIF